MHLPPGQPTVIPGTVCPVPLSLIGGLQISPWQGSATKIKFVHLDCTSKIGQLNLEQVDSAILIDSHGKVLQFTVSITAFS